MHLEISVLDLNALLFFFLANQDGISSAEAVSQCICDVVLGDHFKSYEQANNRHTIWDVLEHP